MKQQFAFSIAFSSLLHFSYAGVLKSTAVPEVDFGNHGPKAISSQISRKSDGFLALQSRSHTHMHEHENAHKQRHKHKEEHLESHKHSGRHIHRHEHIHNHQHNHDHGHKANHEHAHKHSHTGSHIHKHFKHVSRNSYKSDKEYIDRRSGPLPGHSKHHNPMSNGQTKDYHIKSVENYIGDSGKEFEGAAEQIVESYMGEYMQEYMQGWYKKYCEKTGQFCDQVKLKHATKDKKTDREIVYNVNSSAGTSKDKMKLKENEETDQHELQDESEQDENVTTIRKVPKWKLDALKKRLIFKERENDITHSEKPLSDSQLERFSYKNLHKKKFEDYKTYETKSHPSKKKGVHDFIPVETGYQVINDFLLE